MRKAAFLLALLLGATAAEAQLPFLRKRDAQPQQFGKSVVHFEINWAAQFAGKKFFGARIELLGA